MLDLVAAAKFHSNKVSSEAQISVRVLRNELKKKKKKKKRGVDVSENEGPAGGSEEENINELMGATTDLQQQEVAQ